MVTHVSQANALSHAGRPTLTEIFILLGLLYRARLPTDVDTRGAASGWNLVIEIDNTARVATLKSVVRLEREQGY